MIGRKAYNAAELFWSSLDEGEAMVVVYAAAWLVLVVLLALHRRQREALKRELLDEVARAGARG